MNHDLKVGDIIENITGNGVFWPYNKFRYRVTSTSSTTIGLEIIDTEAKTVNG